MPRLAVKMVYTAPVGAQAIPWIGVESGMFAEQGLDVELLRVDSSGRALPVLVSGEAPLVLLTGAAVAGAAASGSDVVMLLSCANTLAFQIMAVPEINSIEQLRGQSVGVSGLGGSGDFALRVALRRFGLDPERDVVVRSIAGGDAQLVAAMQSGALVAAPLAPPSDYHAAQLGLRSLARTAEWDVPYQGAALTTTRGYLAANGDLVRRYLRGYLVALHRAKSDRPYALAVMRQYTGIEDEAALSWAYQEYIERMERVPYPAVAGLQGVIDSLAATNPEVTKVDPASLVDLRPLQEVEQSGLVARLYGP